MNNETRAERWVELIIEDSFNAKMDEQEFAACCETLISHLHPYIDLARLVQEWEMSR